MADAGHRQIQVGRARKWQADTADGPQVFDSEEEVFMLRWLEEAREAGHVAAFERCRSYVLYPAVKKVAAYLGQTRRGLAPKETEWTFLREASYTPDFVFTPTRKFVDEFMGGRDTSEKLAKVLGIGPGPAMRPVTVDVKGGFVLADRRTEFNLKRHAMHDAHGVDVMEIDPAVLFALTWVPRAAAFTAKTGKRRAAFARCPLLGEARPSGGALPDIEL